MRKRANKAPIPDKKSQTEAGNGTTDDVSVILTAITPPLSENPPPPSLNPIESLLAPFGIVELNGPLPILKGFPTITSFKSVNAPNKAIKYTGPCDGLIKYAGPEFPAKSPNPGHPLAS
jgi:hypothetical protein